MTGPEEFYLGDGLYVSFDGEYIKLRAPRLTGDHEVFLDAHTYAALVDYVARVHQRSRQGQAGKPKTVVT